MKILGIKLGIGPLVCLLDDGEPVFESDRFSTVDRILQMALDLAPELSVIDHRRRHIEPRNFVNYDYPVPRHFRFATAEMAIRGVMSAGPE